MCGLTRKYHPQNACTLQANYFTPSDLGAPNLSRAAEIRQTLLKIGKQIVASANLCPCSLEIRSMAWEVRCLAGCSAQERNVHAFCSFLSFHRLFEPAESATSHVKASSRVVKMRRSRREKLVISS